MARVLERSRTKKQKKKKNNGSVAGLKIQPKPGKHNKNSTINKWSERNMQSAIDEFKSENCKLSIRQLSRAWQVLRSTLQMRLKGKVSGCGHMSGRKPVFDEETEADLVLVIKDLAQRGFPFGMKEVNGIQLCTASWN